MNESSPVFQDRAGAGNGSRSRSVVAAVLVALASLGVVMSLAGWWVRTTLFDTEAFIGVVESSLASEEFTTVLSDAVSEQVVAALGVERRIETGLDALDGYVGESLRGMLGLGGSTDSFFGHLDLAPPADVAASLARPVNRAIREGVDDLVRSDAFQEALPDAVAYAHRGAVPLLRGETASSGYVSLVGGEVRWDVLPMVTQAIVHVLDTGALPPFVELVEVPEGAYGEPRRDALASLAAALGSKLPEGFGEVTVMTTATLENWQTTARALDRAVHAAMITTLAFALAALTLAVERRRTLVRFAFGSVVAVLIAGLLQRGALQVFDTAIRGRTQRAAFNVLLDSLAGSLQGTAVVYILTAGAVGMLAHVAGRPPWLAALRNPRRYSKAGPVPNLGEFIAANRGVSTGGGVLIAVGTLWWWGTSLASLMLVAAALGGYIGYVISAASPEPESAPGEMWCANR